jgi:hypothetical protein
MELHIRILGYLYIAMGIAAVLAVAIILGAYRGPMGVLHMGSLDGNQTTDDGMIWTVVWVFWLVIAGPCLMAGQGLLGFKPWARPFTMVLSILNLANVPFGTLLSIYSFWACTTPEVEPLFEKKRRGDRY